MNKNEILLNALGDIRDEYIEEIHAPNRRRKAPWIGAAAAAACLALAAAALFSGIFKGHTAHAEGYVDIYYIGENAEMTSEPVYTELTQDKIVTAWSERNNVSEINIAAVNVSDNGDENEIVSYWITTKSDAAHDTPNAYDFLRQDGYHAAQVVCMVTIDHVPDDYSALNYKELVESFTWTIDGYKDLPEVQVVPNGELEQYLTKPDDDEHTLCIIKWYFVLPDGSVVDEDGNIADIDVKFTTVTE